MNVGWEKKLELQCQLELGDNEILETVEKEVNQQTKKYGCNLD